VKAFRWAGWFFALLGVAFGTTFLLVGFIFMIIGPAATAQEKLIATVAATGILGSAAIADIEPTGLSINDSPQCRITVTVSLPEQPSYQVTVKQVIPLAALPRFVPDAVVPCRVAPQDLSLVVLIADTAMAPIRRAGPPPGRRPGPPPGPSALSSDQRNPCARALRRALALVLSAEPQQQRIRLGGQMTGWG
jgi:hypothetical protein